MFGLYVVYDDLTQEILVIIPAFNDAVVRRSCISALQVNKDLQFRANDVSVYKVGSIDRESLAVTGVNPRDKCFVLSQLLDKEVANIEK